MVVPAPKPLRFRKLDEDWWRAFRGDRIYDLYKDAGPNQYRAIVMGRGGHIKAQATFDLATRGAWTKARQFLEADGVVPGIRWKAVA